MCQIRVRTRDPPRNPSSETRGEMGSEIGGSSEIHVARFGWAELTRLRGCRIFCFSRHVSACDWLMLVGPTFYVGSETRGEMGSEIWWYFGKPIPLMVFSLIQVYNYGKNKNAPFLKYILYSNNLQKL